MKVLLVAVAVVAGLGFLLFRNGHFSFYAYSVSQNDNGQASVHCYAGCNTDVVQSARVEATGSASAVVQDALMIVQASGRSDVYAQSLERLLSLIQRAHRLSRPSGAALIWRQAPAFTHAMDDQL